MDGPLAVALLQLEGPGHQGQGAGEGEQHLHVERLGGEGAHPGGGGPVQVGHVLRAGLLQGRGVPRLQAGPQPRVAQLQGLQAVVAPAQVQALGPGQGLLALRVLGFRQHPRRGLHEGVGVHGEHGAGGQQQVGVFRGLRPEAIRTASWRRAGRRRPAAGSSSPVNTVLLPEEDSIPATELTARRLSEQPPEASRTRTDGEGKAGAHGANMPRMRRRCKPSGIFLTREGGRGYTGRRRWRRRSARFSPSPR